MILFHGTLEENLKNIKKHGILDYTSDQWLMEITGRKFCCVSPQPTSGEGGNASYFAYGFVKTKNQAGYLVVLDVPREILKSKIIAILDNKTLDDYVKFHFFPRQEFQEIGYTLFQKLIEHQQKDRYFQKLPFSCEQKIVEPKDIPYQKDQRAYYKKIRDQRFMASLLGLQITDELWDLIQLFGSWEAFFEFLKMHFGQISTLDYEAFQAKAWQNVAQFWTEFYQRFPLPITQERQQHIQDWFSPKWLRSRQLTEPTENCQILCQSIEPSSVVGFIKITTPSGFAERFRNFRSKSAFSTEVWKEVHQLIKQKD